MEKTPVRITSSVYVGCGERMLHQTWRLKSLRPPGDANGALESGGS